MKYGLVVVGILLAVVLLLQFQILNRLSAIERKSTRLPTITHSSTPSADAIAAKIIHEMAREARLKGPATFQVKPSGGSQAYKGKEENIDLASARLKEARLLVTREGGTITNLHLNFPSGMYGSLKLLRSTEGVDLYNVVFQPDDSTNLPQEWTFSLDWIGADAKHHQRAYFVTYRPRQKPHFLNISEVIPVIPSNFPPAVAPQ